MASERAARRTFDLFVLELSLRPGAPSDQVAWRRTLRSSSRRQAVLSCKGDLLRLWAQVEQPRIRRMSVWVGDHGDPSGYAGRLDPLQIDRDGNIVSR